jgi:hypothetical protein
LQRRPKPTPGCSSKKEEEEEEEEEECSRSHQSRGTTQSISKKSDEITYSLDRRRTNMNADFLCGNITEYNFEGKEDFRQVNWSGMT